MVGGIYTNPKDLVIELGWLSGIRHSPLSISIQDASKYFRKETLQNIVMIAVGLGVFASMARADDGTGGYCSL